MTVFHYDHHRIEDFAQVFGVYPSRKYDDVRYRNIAQALWIETGKEGTCEFIRRLVFKALIGNIWVIPIWRAFQAR